MCNRKSFWKNLCNKVLEGQGLKPPQDVPQEVQELEGSENHGGKLFLPSQGQPELDKTHPGKLKRKTPASTRSLYQLFGLLSKCHEAYQQGKATKAESRQTAG